MGLEHLSSAALEHLIEALLAQQKWQLADDQLSYFEWLNDEIYLRDFYDYLRGTSSSVSCSIEHRPMPKIPTAPGISFWQRISAGARSARSRQLLGKQILSWCPGCMMWFAHYYQVSLVKRRSLLNEVT